MTAKDSTVIPRRPLLWLAAAFLFLVPTMLGNVALWVPLIFLATLLAKFWMETRDLRLRSIVLKVVIALAGFGAVLATYGSLTGVEAGVSLLVILAALKVLESHTPRDFHVLVLVGWVLCLCAFIMSQEFTVALCILAAFFLLAVALIQFHRRQASGGAVWPPLLAAGRLLVQTLPLVVLLFFFFPRGTAGIRLRLPGSPADSTGFSGELSPGSVASLASSDELAFRVEFPNRDMPPRAELYWRGAVLWEGSGMNWRVGQGVGRAQPSQRPAAETIRQRITLEPHAGRWLFALDRPISAPPGANLVPGRYLHSPRRITNLRRYEVLSAADATQDELRPRERAALLNLPATISPAVRNLAESWAAQNSDPRSVVRAALEFFRTQGFVYSISPGQYEGAGALDEFLFNRKVGFCEHYAGTFTTLMRAAGIPARVVVGYLGGQYNQWGNYLLVRQADAHAWSEVWLPDAGWERVDPTSVIAPERINLGSLREMNAAARNGTNANQSAGNRAGAVSGFFDDLRLAWDTVSFAWDTRVLSFDLEAQRAFFTQWRIDSWSGGSLLFWIIAMATVLLFVYALWIRWRARPRQDMAKKLYEQFCFRAARLGAVRSPWEGPADFASRAALLLPQQAERIRRISADYILLRYAPAASTSSSIDRLATEVRRFPDQ